MNEDIQGSNAGITALIYGLQGLSLLVGVTLIVGVVINYVKRDDVRGSWLESHFRWQIHTFWFSVLWTLLGLATVLILVGYLILFLAALWLIYRVLKGWLRLQDGKAMYSADQGPG